MPALRPALPLLAALVMTAACAGAPPPPASTPVAAPPEPSGPPAPPPAEAAPPAPPPDVPAPAGRAAPAPIEETLPSLTRGFTAVRVQGVKEPFISIGGRGRELLFLTEEGFGGRSPGRGGYGVVYRSDGARVLERLVPCGDYGYYGVTASADEILLDGHNLWFRGVPGRLWASRLGTRRAGWDCSREFSGGFAVPSGGRVWRYECLFAEGCAVRARGLPDVPVPRPDGGAVAVLWMRGADDGWMVYPEGDGRSALLRYNGVTWAKRASLDDLEAWDLWVDADDHPWILARRGKPQEHYRTAAGAVLRFDGQALVELAVPRGFAATMLRATGPDDLWFLGAERAAYQWDGQRLRRGMTPFVPTAAWAQPGGEVWIIGDKTPGTAAHTLPAPGLQTSGGHR